MSKSGEIIYKVGDKTPLLSMYFIFTLKVLNNINDGKFGMVMLRISLRLPRNKNSKSWFFGNLPSLHSFSCPQNLHIEIVN